MKRWRHGALLGLLFAAVVGCGDPTGPRIPQPDDEEEPPDPTQTLTQPIKSTGTQS